MAVDAWILPTDQYAHVRSLSWKVYGTERGERRGEFSKEFQEGRVFAQRLPWKAATPGAPVVTAVPVSGVY